MRFPSYVPHQKITKGKIFSKISKIFYLFVIIMMLSGISLAETNRDVIIGFKKPVGPSENELVHGYNGIVKKSFHIIPAIAARLPESKIEELKKDPRIAYIEEERVYKVADEYSNSWGVQHIGSQPVHNQSIYGDGVKIAVLDSGIDYNHPDLIENYKGGYDFANNDTDPMDDYGHGTHVSGIIAAKNNGFGVIGVAPNASIYAIKVLTPIGGKTSWIISGIQWAVDNKMDIATMSFVCLPNPIGEPCDDPALRDTLNNAYNNSGLLLVAAGGNTYGGEVLYPAAYDSVIAVTATDKNDKNASLSPIGSKIELAAPGVDILSTVPTGCYSLCDPSGYRYLSGTSMATPHVTGVAALIYDGNLTDVNGDGLKNNKDVRAILQNTARDLGNIGKDNIYGYGLVDAQKAVLGIEYILPKEKPFIVNLTLTRTKRPEIKDAKNVSISQGNYSIKIKNINLTRVYMVVYENGTIRKDLSSYFKFNRSQEIEKKIYANNTLNIVFIPYGDKGTIGYVTIRTL